MEEVKSDFGKALGKVASKAEGLSESDKKRISQPVSTYKIVFQSDQAQVEPIYYWILDFLRDGGWDVQKIVDNFMASPGSGQYLEVGQRVTRLQDEATKLLGGLNQVIKSVINLIYDLREFEIRLSYYDNAKSDDPKKRQEGLLALKQIWLDNVDIKKGRGAIHNMATELGFGTLRDAFMICNTPDDARKLNSDEEGGIINDQVMRILIARIEEFRLWVDYSEKELRKRMNIERNYLKSQVETIKLYASWARPYIRDAEKLRQKGFEGDAALVSAFSTSLFELSLLAKKKEGLPWQFKEGGYIQKKDYYACIVVDLMYRGHVSQRATQQGDIAFVRGGRVEIVIESYALSEHEINLALEEVRDEDIIDALKFSTDVAIDSIEQIKEDIDHFLGGEKEEEKKEESKDKIEDPFTALGSLFVSLFKKRRKEVKKKEVKDPKDLDKDNYIERVVRANAAKNASDGAFLIYDIYKKSHGMPSAPVEFDNSNEELLEAPEVKFAGAFRKWENV